MEIKIIIEIGFNMENLMEFWTTMTFFGVIMPIVSIHVKKIKKVCKNSCTIETKLAQLFFYMKLDVCIIGNRWELFQPY